MSFRRRWLETARAQALGLDQLWVQLLPYYLKLWGLRLLSWPLGLSFFIPRFLPCKTDTKMKPHKTCQVPTTPPRTWEGCEKCLFSPFIGQIIFLPIQILFTLLKTLFSYEWVSSYTQSPNTYLETGKCLCGLNLWFPCLWRLVVLRNWDTSKFLGLEVREAR